MELFYNPERMSETEIKETFVARNWLVEEIMSILTKQPDGAGVQHAIIIAPRGMGKTTVLLMLRFAVLQSEASKHWQPVLFPEESYQVYDLADFWLAVLDHLSSETADEELADEVIRLPPTQDPEEVALARIKDWRKTHKKRLLLLVDNLDIILEQISNERDQARLRDELMNDGTMMVVGGAPTHFKAIKGYDQPLYNLFKIYNLDELNTDQIKDLLRRRANIDQVEGFEEVLKKNASRLRVLEYFTGGNPRLVLMLYRVITHSHISDVKRDLEKLLDEVTPYYKAKIENLPPQQRKILDHIARVTARTGEGLTPTEIATATRLAVNQVSSQLKRLGDIGYVRSANIRGRSSYYTLSEPLYAIWHQMRFGRDARKRMQWLVSFIKGWYDAEEVSNECERLQDVFTTHLREGHVSEARDALEHRRYLVEAIVSESLRAQTMESIVLSVLELKDDQTLNDILAGVDLGQLTEETQTKLLAERRIGEGKLTSTTRSPAQEGEESWQTALNRAKAMAEEHHFHEAKDNFEAAIRLNPVALEGYVGLALIRAYDGQGNETVEILRQAEAAISKDSAFNLFAHGCRLILTNSFAEAEEILTELSLEQSGSIWCFAGVLLELLDRHEQALSSFLRSSKLDPSIYESWYYGAKLLNERDRHLEALGALDTALQLRPEAYEAHHERARALAGIGDNANAVQGYDRALELNPESSETWADRGLSLLAIGEVDEASSSFDKAFEIEPTSYGAMFGKCLASMVSLRLEEAIKSSELLLKTHPSSDDALYIRGVALMLSGEHKEALDSLRNAFRKPSELQWLREGSTSHSFRLIVALADGNIEQAQLDWQRLKETAEHEGGEEKWVSLVTQTLRQAAIFGNWHLIRALITNSDLDERLFPLARALDYLITGDETLIEMLSPEVRVIVERVIEEVQSASSLNLEKEGHKKQRSLRTKAKKKTTVPISRQTIKRRKPS